MRCTLDRFHHCHRQACVGVFLDPCLAAPTRERCNRHSACGSTVLTSLAESLHAMASKSAAELWAEMKAGQERGARKASAPRAGAVVLANLNRPDARKGKKGKKGKNGKKATKESKARQVIVPAFLQQATGRTFTGNNKGAKVTRGSSGTPPAASTGEDTPTPAAGAGVGAGAGGTEVGLPLGSVSVQDFLAHVARDINCVSDEALGVRVAALKRLDAQLFGKQRCLTDDQLQDVFPEFTKPLLKRFSDPSEKCREYSIGIVRGCLHARCNRPTRACPNSHSLHALTGDKIHRAHFGPGPGPPVHHASH